MNYTTEAYKVAASVTDLESGHDAVAKVHELRRLCLNEMRELAEQGDNAAYNELEAVRYDLLQVVRSIQSEMGKYASIKIANKRKLN